VNLGLEIEFRSFYNFGTPVISSIRLNNYVPGHGTRAKPTGQHNRGHNNCGSGQLKI
jgi:hypothetical protein